MASSSVLAAPAKEDLTHPPQGANKFSAERRRWFELDHRRKVLYYFKKPNLPSTSCIGFVDLMLASSIVPDNEKLSQFQINTPGRSYVLTAPSESEFKRWVNGLSLFHTVEARRQPPGSCQLLQELSHESAEHLRLLDYPKPQLPHQKRSPSNLALGETNRNQRERSTRTPTQAPKSRLDEVDLMKEYSQLLETHASMRKQLEETKEQLSRLQNGAQKAWEELALEHQDTVDELGQAKHELELAKTQLAESKENLIAEKEKQMKRLTAESELGQQDASQAAELEFAEELMKLRRESMREMERMGWVWAREKERWARERAHLQRALALARDEWQLEKRQERKEWERERHEWLNRVAMLSGSRGEDEDEDEDDDGDGSGGDDEDDDDDEDDSPASGAAGVAESLFRSFSSF